MRISRERQDSGALADGGGLTDAGLPDAGSFDAGTGDSGTGDSGTGDSGTGDSGIGDSGIGDSGVFAGTDAGRPDGGTTDAGPLDAGVRDAGSDAGSFDAGPTCGHDGGASTLVWFINRSRSQTFVVYRQNAQCQLVPVSTLPPGKYAAQSTDGLDSWEVSDQASGAVLLSGALGAPAYVLPTGDQSVCSSVFGTGVTVTFENVATDRTYDVTWVDPGCVEQPTATLDAGGTFAVNTNTNQVFHFRNVDGGTLEHIGLVRADSGVMAAPLCSAGGSNPAATAYFYNQYTSLTLQLYWVDPTCVEHLADEIAPQGGVGQSTSIGHVFRLRNKLTGELMATPDPVSADMQSFTFP